VLLLRQCIHSRHDEQLTEELSRLPNWHREALLPMMKAAHKFTASREEFIGLALSVWRGCDPDDLPLEGGTEVGKRK